ncbi:MAG: ABC transporter ATP-binding protein [Candidatus Aminicenantes bacterium]|nr:ABC transporter ATP-binding protein [Candidatus Aminicenantes bacterium]
METQPVLSLQHLEKKYREFRLNIESLCLERGSILGLIGPNGAGKTTTVKILMNMIRRSGGEVRVLGLNPRKDEKEIKQRVGYVGEEPAFYGDKTVDWTGKYVSGFFRKWDTNRFQELLDRFAISRSKKIQELSKGMKVKLALALALSHDAEFYILDEPTAGLDPIIRREVLELLLAESREHERSVLISSHITDDISRLADRIAFLVEGRVVLSRLKDDINADWKKIHYKRGALDKDTTASLFSRKEHAFSLSGITNKFQELKQKFEKPVLDGDVKVENVDLDDILIALVEGEKSCG